MSGKKNYPKITSHSLSTTMYNKPDKILRESGFLLTINTNYEPGNKDDVLSLGGDLHQAVDDMLKGINPQTEEPNIKSVIKFIGKRADDEYSLDTIDNIEYTVAIEQGTKAKGGRVHAHINIKIQHYSIVQLNTEEIQTFINHHLWEHSRYPVEGVHINVRYVGGYKNMETYIAKGPLNIIPKSNQV